MASLKKNFFYQCVWQVLILILPLVTSPYLSRVIGAKGLGIYSLTYSIITYFALVANLGIDKYGNREIAKKRNDREARSKVFSEIYFIHIIISLIVIFIYFIYVYLWAEYKRYSIIQSLYLIAALLSFTWLYAGMEDFKKIVFRDSIIKIVIVVCIFVFVRDCDDLWIYILIMAIASITSSMVLWLSVRSYVDFKRVELRNVIVHLKPMLVLFVPVALENIYSYMDRIMLGFQSGIEQVGYYDNSIKALISKSIVFSIGTVMMPRITTLLEEKQEEKVKNYLSKSTELVIILSVAFAFGTAAISFEFAPVFWGRDFTNCAWIIFIMSFSLPFQCLANEIRTHFLIPAARDKEYMFSAAAGTVFNFISNLILIPRFGAIGAAVTTLLSEMIVLIAQVYICRKDCSFLKYILNNKIYFLFGMTMFIIVRMLGRYLGIQIYTIMLEVFVGGLIYLISCLVYWKVSGKTYWFDMLKKV